jgi:hypothetical protein
MMPFVLSRGKHKLYMRKAFLMNSYKVSSDKDCAIGSPQRSNFKVKKSPLGRVNKNKIIKKKTEVDYHRLHIFESS